jgi:hypothetical protein
MLSFLAFLSGLVLCPPPFCLGGLSLNQQSWGVWRLTTQHSSDGEHEGKGADIEQQGDLDHEGYYGP